MLKVGITGGIGSGKSTVCRIFETLGIPVFNADLQAQLLLTTPEVISFYKKEFGELVFTDNQLDKPKIAQLIFTNKIALEKINQFIHPLVFDLFDKWCKTYSNSSFVIKEAALLFETGAYNTLDFNVLVTCPEEIRIERVMQRNGISREQVVQRINNQWPDEKKKPLAQAEIINDGQNAILTQTLTLHKLLKNKK